jgi:hypothetical protein
MKEWSFQKAILLKASSGIAKSRGPFFFFTPVRKNNK